MEDLYQHDEFTTTYRALSLGVLLLRAHMEQITRVETAAVPEITERDHARLVLWADKEGIAAHYSPLERQVIYAELGTWPRQGLIDASWRTEAVGMLLWALQLVPAVPAYDRTFTPGEVLHPLRLLRPTGDVFKAAVLRPAAAIEQARGEAELWHWRSRTRRIRRMGVTPPGGMTFEEIIAQAAAHITSGVRGDFCAYGKPYHQLTENEYATVTSIARERHFGLNWLCGYGSNWDDTPTDT